MGFQRVDAGAQLIHDAGLPCTRIGNGTYVTGRTGMLLQVQVSTYGVRLTEHHWDGGESLKPTGLAWTASSSLGAMEDLRVWRRR